RDLLDTAPAQVVPQRLPQTAERGPVSHPHAGQDEAQPGNAVSLLRRVMQRGGEHRANIAARAHHPPAESRVGQPLLQRAPVDVSVAVDSPPEKPRHLTKIALAERVGRPYGRLKANHFCCSSLSRPNSWRAAKRHTSGLKGQAATARSHISRTCSDAPSPQFSKVSAQRM